ncbi:MAG: hypothetical protein AAF500_07445 [Myxococcota bacterium]
MRIAPRVVSTVFQPNGEAHQSVPYSAPDDKALLVFLQDPTNPRPSPTVYVTGEFECVAIVMKQGAECETVVLVPGYYDIEGERESVPRIGLQIEEGRTYFVRTRR